jgi:hypothetical protein
MADGWVHGDDFSGRFMTQDVVSLDDHRTDATSVPEVNIGTIPLSAIALSEAGLKARGNYPQIPVFRIATLTSPCFKSEPDLTASAEGSAAATQRSWLGLV